jgi:LEA14-like dessication related protein
MNLRHNSCPPSFGKAACLSLLLLVPLTLAGCAGLGLGESIRRPQVDVVGVDIQEVHLTGADLLLEFEVDNPNAVGLLLDQVGYRLRMNGEHLLDGRREERTQIAAHGESRVTIPVNVQFDDLYRVIRSFRGTDRAQRPSYQLDADFRFDVPLLGAVTVPVSKEGDIPLERLERFMSSRSR